MKIPHLLSSSLAFFVQSSRYLGAPGTERIFRSVSADEVSLAATLMQSGFRYQRRSSFCNVIRLVHHPRENESRPHPTPTLMP